MYIRVEHMKVTAYDDVQGQDASLTLFSLICGLRWKVTVSPDSEKLVPHITAHDIGGNRPLKPYAKSESDAHLVMYDVYWQAI
jgi:hypothetical protein